MTGFSKIGRIMEQDLPEYFQSKFSFFDKFAGRRWISSAAALIAGLAVLVYYFQSGPMALDFAKAELLVAKWRSLPEDASLFQQMSHALKKVPALQKKYEPVIAQKLIDGGRSAEALQIAYRSLESAKKEAPYHAHFAETSLFIERGEHQEALERSAGLKEKMLRECNVEAFSGARLIGGSVLFAYNLLRIACLQQELKNQPGERAAWEELEKFLKKNENGPAALTLLSNFQEKDLDLTDYIAERKSLLK
jgi:hypothetical protein